MISVAPHQIVGPAPFRGSSLERGGDGSNCVVPVTEPTTRLVSEQGSEIGRLGRLHVEVDCPGGEISAVRVGGQVVMVAEGVVRF